MFPSLILRLAVWSGGLSPAVCLHLQKSGLVCLWAELSRGFLIRAFFCCQGAHLHLWPCLSFCVCLSICLSVGCLSSSILSSPLLLLVIGLRANVVEHQLG